MVNNEMKVRTTCELSMMLRCFGAILLLSSVATFMMVKNILGFLVALLVPITYIAVSYLIIKREKNALALNYIEERGIKNAYLGEFMCEMSWSEIGDFGVAEVKRGLYKGKYIYVSRIFVNNAIRRNIIKRYDPRVCIVVPYTEEVREMLSAASGGKIDV
jgi:predicted membrane protein